MGLPLLKAQYLEVTSVSSADQKLLEMVFLLPFVAQLVTNATKNTVSSDFLSTFPR